MKPSSAPRETPRVRQLLGCKESVLETKLADYHIKLYKHCRKQKAHITPICASPSLCPWRCCTYMCIGSPDKTFEPEKRIDFLLPFFLIHSYHIALGFVLTNNFKYIKKFCTVHYSYLCIQACDIAHVQIPVALAPTGPWGSRPSQ